MRMDAQIVVWLVFLVLIKNFSRPVANISFTVKSTKLTAKEGSCIEITCTGTAGTDRDDEAYWFWIKDKKYVDKDKVYTGTIIYSTNTTKRSIDKNFVDKVKYTGYPSLRLKESQCGILICNLTLSDSGDYSFRYVGTGSQKWMTDSAIVKVEVNPCLLTFEKPPAVKENGTITLTCSTLQSCPENPQIIDLTQRPPKVLQNAVNTKTATINFEASSADDERLFSCQTQNNRDHYLIRNITVNVQYPPKDIQARSSSNGVEGDRVIFTCSAKGGPHPTISWFKDGQLQSTEAKWMIESISISHNGKYYCTAENRYGNITSKAVNINVEYAPHVEIKMNPDISEVREGDQIILTCDVKRSNPPPSAFTWLKDERRIYERQKYVKRMEPEDSGSYKCTATNRVGTGTSPQHQIKVQYSPRKTAISTYPTDPPNRVKVGNSLRLTCKTEAYPNPHTYSWYHYKENEPINPPMSLTKSSEILYLSNVQRGDEACYMCNATNSIATGDNSEPLCIEVLYPPTKTTLFMADEVTEGDNITVSCTVESYPLSDLILKRKSTSDVTQQTMFSCHNNTLRYTFVVDSTHTLAYSCMATNSEGSEESKQRMLVVKYRPKEVTIRGEPNLAVDENQSLTLHCNAQALPSVTSVTWKKMTNGKEVIIRKDTTGDFTVKFASPSDHGLYSCEAKNDIGIGKSQLTQVEVRYAPKHTNITREGEKKESDGRTYVILSCNSHSFPPIQNYSWYKKGEKGDILMSSQQKYRVYSNEPGAYYCIAGNKINKKSSDPVYVFIFETMQILRLFFLCLFVLLIVVFFIIVCRCKRKNSIQRGATNTQLDFLHWWNGTRRGNLMNETVMSEPFRSRDDLLPEQPCHPKAQRRQPHPDSTPAPNISSVYCTVTLPPGKQAPTAKYPTGQQGGGTEDDALNYASLHFMNKPKNKLVKAEEDAVYTKVSKPKLPEKERLEDYENVAMVHAPKTPYPFDDDSDTSEDGDVELNYTQVTFTAKPGHQRAHRNSSSSDEDEIQYSDVKI